MEFNPTGNTVKDYICSLNKNHGEYSKIKMKPLKYSYHSSKELKYN